MVATAILTEAGLAFLGLGDPNVISWGSIIGAGRDALRSAWYITAIPGIAILLTVLALNLVGEGLNDALNPRLKNRCLDLLTEMRDRFGMGVILITHDLGVVAETADRVVVMYAGRKIEEAPVGDLFRRPLHPYTQGLIRATPEAGRRKRLIEIPGMVPALNAMPPGCTFAPRCPFAIEACRAAVPPLREHGLGHWAACIRVPVTLDAHAASGLGAMS